METIKFVLLISIVFFGLLALISGIGVFSVTKRVFYFLIASFFICIVSLFTIHKIQVYNKTSSAICRNIEKNPDNWESIFSLDIMKATKYTLPPLTNHFWANEHLVNKPCGIDLVIDAYGYYASVKVVEGDSILQTFNNEESIDILEAFNEYITKPKNEYQERLMEPIRLVREWKEEEQSNALKNRIESCK